MADICDKISEVKRSEWGQKHYNQHQYETFYEIILEYDFIEQALKLMGMYENKNDIQFVYEQIGIYQSDQHKFSLFFEKTQAHFIQYNLQLYYDQNKAITIGNEIPNTSLISKDGKLNNQTTNCKNYNDIDTRIQRAKQFEEITQNQFQLYLDNIKNEYANLFQAWPDKYYLVDNLNKTVIYESGINYRAQGEVDIDCVWLLKYLWFCKQKRPENKMEQNILNMVHSFQKVVDKKKNEKI
ncbi:hypothetical protein PPERSA_04643 [Pseudocohnilembus persalinus]|uniref:Uncharacterized protein n=1 Tax=Pseudocohnilembus persalinus TaxID=266149 RepID=A0A0V0QP74_PSEPJ|nr:hypothetical protein PPERSA_04643 [Pseudocohnilembus persalinus]|eukprot:KRX03848.1 hypothetical protein PPERSA_04643 [Pseudocohnilembus persalinus]